MSADPREETYDFDMWEQGALIAQRQDWEREQYRRADEEFFPSEFEDVRDVG